MRIAIPLTEGRLAQHFGHCEKFALVDIDTEKRSVTAVTEVDAPEHEPGLLPSWLSARQVNMVIAGGMGTRAQSLFGDASIRVITGAAGGTAQSLAEEYLNGTLVSRPSTCDHGCH